MTIQTQGNKAIALGDCVTTQFDFDFVGVAAGFIDVIYTDANGYETVLTQGAGSSQYQIVLNPPVTGAIWGLGGTVTYNPGGTPIPAGSTLTIFRTLPLTQAISLANQNSLASLGKGAETGLDTGTMQLQQVSENIARAIVAPVVDPTPPAPLPPIAQRANKGAAFDAAGNLVAGTTPSSGVISSAMQPVVSAATLALGRTAFGLGDMAVEDIGSGLQDDGAGAARVNSPVQQVATNQAIHKADHLNVYAASGALTFTLDRANTLFNGFSFTVYALTGNITLTPNANDSFSGQSSGTSYTLPQGSVASFSTDGANSGLWIVNPTGVSSIAGNKGAFTLGGLMSNTGNQINVTAASQAQQQAGTATNVAVTPNNQQQHDSATKAWVSFFGASGTIVASYNVASVSRNSAGSYTVVFTVPFGGVSYECNVTAEGAATGGIIGIIPAGGRAAGFVSIQVLDSSFGNADATVVHLACHGR